MECVKAVEVTCDRVALADMKENERYALLLHIRRCVHCREGLTVRDFVDTILAVLSPQENTRQ
jgi:hypothetical protein